MNKKLFICFFFKKKNRIMQLKCDVFVKKFYELSKIIILDSTFATGGFHYFSIT